MRVVILKDAQAVAHYGAQLFVKQIAQKPASVLGLATGSTPVNLYKELIKANKAGQVSFKQTTSFNLDEYLGLAASHNQSYRYFMNEQLFNHIDINIKNTHVPNGMHPNPKQAGSDYEQAITHAGGIDLQLLGIGRNGHIGFNEPSSSLASRTRVKTLTQATIDDNARFFAENEYQPELSITMGIGTIMESKQVLLLATGESKADAIAATVEGPISAMCPASALQMHQDAIIVIDEAAATKLTNKDFYQFIEKQQRKLETD
ncbi:glucosamine-6-phosphate deaminase [Paraferrimonas sp. SM1919]|uniref:glucosamine-6-phosphate deaminase n=1 Tax=Paraferrimonas sp. SM1919 TaxID=2662263 RepID=UPI0013D53989|nr:glucosamine-6-phosphate deaminase [Paraferrimonas sp. SM1919]